MFGPDRTVEIVDKPLSDDFMNLIEVACSVKPTSASPEDDSEAALIGVTFLHKHCLVVDLAGSSQADEQEPLLKRTFELKLRILQDMLGWQLLVVDEAEYTKLKSKQEKEEYIMERLQKEDGATEQEPVREEQGGRRVKRVNKKM